VGKFVRRNRVACFSGAAVVLSLFAGLGAATAMYLKERKALTEQALLRQEAEAARTRESALRKQAQARANISQVAVLLTEGKVEEADALLRDSPLESIEPSREAAGVFRTLGSRNAMYGRWKQAIQCYVLLDQANRLDNPIKTVSEGDLIMIAAALLKGGNLPAYEKFRHETLDRHLPATNSLQAEHLLKIALLTPPGDEILRRLDPVSKVCESGFRNNNKTWKYPGWEAFSLVLYHLRRNDPKTALEWAKKTLSFEDSQGSRTASTLCLTAMAKFQLGDSSQALEDLNVAQRMVNDGTQFSPTWDEVSRGSWFSWVVAEILLDEATAEVKGAEESSNPAGN
jgi:tetratricopeptide (TPR) repeat protein